MKNLKGNGGITLVALVITIIILLILATITISMVLGNEGLIARAKKGGNDYKLAAAQEQNNLKDIDAQFDSLLTGSGDTTPTSLTAAQIEFTPDDENWDVHTVEEALNYLFGE